MSRRLSETEASAMIVSGFVEPVTKELLVEYAVDRPAHENPNSRSRVHARTRGRVPTLTSMFLGSGPLARAVA